MSGFENSVINERRRRMPATILLPMRASATHTQVGSAVASAEDNLSIDDRRRHTLMMLREAMTSASGTHTHTQVGSAVASAEDNLRIDDRRRHALMLLLLLPPRNDGERWPANPMEPLVPLLASRVESSKSSAC